MLPWGGGLVGRGEALAFPELGLQCEQGGRTDAWLGFVASEEAALRLATGGCVKGCAESEPAVALPMSMTLAVLCISAVELTWAFPSPGRPRPLSESPLWQTTVRDESVVLTGAGGPTGLQSHAVVGWPVGGPGTTPEQTSKHSKMTPKQLPRPAGPALKRF